MVEGSGSGEHVLAHLPDHRIGHPIGRVTGRVIRVAVADRTDIEAGDAGPFEDGEVRVVGQPFVDFLRDRPAPRLGCDAPRGHQRAITWTGFEQDGGHVAPGVVQIDVRAHAASHLGVVHEGGGSEQTQFLAIGQEHHEAALAVALRRQQPSDLQTHRDAEAIVCRTGRGIIRVVVRDERDGAGVASRMHRDDVGDVGGQSVLGAGRVGFLHADGKAVEAELLNQVFARLPVGVAAERTGTDGPRQAVDVCARVVNGEERRRPRAGRTTKREEARQDQRGAMQSCRHADSLSQVGPGPAQQDSKGAVEGCGRKVRRKVR